MKKLLIAVFIILLFSLLGCAAADTFRTETGIRFGMTPEDVEFLETMDNHTLDDAYDAPDSYQLYYEDDIHLFSLRSTRMEYDFDSENRLLFQFCYIAEDGAPGYEYWKAMLAAQYGSPYTDENSIERYSLLFEQLGRGEGHTEAVHWIASDQGLGIDLWYNHSQTVFAVFYDLAASAPAPTPDPTVPMPVGYDYPPITIETVPERPITDNCLLLDGNAVNETKICISGGKLYLTVSVKDAAGKEMILDNGGTLEGISGLEDGEYTIFAYSVPEVAPVSLKLIINRSR